MQDLEWTGERYVPQLMGDIALEHLHRYAFACELSEGKRVLDIACGEGYGSEMLSRNAKSVTGVDIDPASVAHAKKKYSSPKLNFLEGACEKIPLPDKSVDLVVSFETLEHIEDHRRFLSEVLRVLDKNGVLVISTPEKSAYSHRGAPPNPFHKKELNRAEFVQVLSSFFPQTVIFEQKITFGSQLVSPNKGTQGFATVDFETLPSGIKTAHGLAGAVYLVAVCGRATLPPVRNSLCEQKVWESEIWTKNFAPKEELAKNLDEQLRLAREAQARSEIRLEEVSKKAESLETHLVRVERLKTELAELRKDHQEAEVRGRETVEKSVGELKNELASQRKEQKESRDEATKSGQELRQELEAQKVATEKGAKELGDSLVEVKQALIDELRTLAGRMSQIEEKNLAEMVALRTTFEGRLSKNESNLQEVARYVGQIQDSVIAPSSYLIPAPFSWYAYLYKMLNIRKPRFITGKIPTANSSPPRPGFWRRLEQSIRKRRKRLQAWIGFDREWYLREYPEVGHSGINPLDHYLLYGSKEGRWKSQKHKEKTGFFRKMERFLRRQRKRFIARINFDREWYLRQYPELRGTQVDLIEHYLTTGTAQGRSKSEREKEKNFLKILPYLENTHGESCADRIKNIYHLFLWDKKRPKASGEFFKKSRDSVTTLMEELAVSVRKHRQKLCLPPRASIIIPMYEQVLYTLGCLVALIESDPQVTFEVIVADDCSSPATQNLLRSLPAPIRIAASSVNQGFVRNCNQAERLARGEFLVFLNNDMLVLPGWLDNLIETFELHPKCGIAGSKLLNYDGTLQEAGGIFWKDGSAWNYGRGSDPDLPEFNYCRTVDYCSGASICIRKKDWDELGGFDEVYERAYCEDADLSFRMRRDKGLETVYNPFSVGIHLEGISSGTDTSTGEKAYQVVNQKKFFSRWKRTLEAEHESNGKNVFQARGRNRQRKTVLIADHYIPEEDKDAGSRTMSQITRLILKNKADVVLWPQNLNYIKKYAQCFQKIGVQVIYNTKRHLSLTEWLSENKKYIHSYFIARPQVLEDFLKIIDPTTSKIFFYGMDVHHLRLESQLKNDPDNEKLRQEKNHWEKTEKKLWEKVSFLLYPSKNETKYISDFLKNKRKNFEVRTMPVFYWESFTDKKSLTVKNRTGLFYVAGFSHTPNVEGILWFVDKVFPLVLQKMPNCILKIAGSNLPAQVENLKNKNIQILGYISEKQLKLNYLNTRVAIAPLLSGAGMKGKVAEALRHGVPMVTTSFGAQGFEDGKGVVAAFNDLHGMAEKILELLRDENKWLAAATQSVELAQKMFSEKNMWNTIKELIE